jgi:hypothetical protein
MSAEHGEIDSACESSTQMPSTGPPPDHLLRRTLEGELEEAPTVTVAELELFPVRVHPDVCLLRLPLQVEQGCYDCGHGALHSKPPVLGADEDPGRFPPSQLEGPVVLRQGVEDEEPVFEKLASTKHVWI